MTVAAFIAIEAGQQWASLDDGAIITVEHPENARWVVCTAAGDTLTVIAADLRTQYRLVDTSL